MSCRLALAHVKPLAITMHGLKLPCVALLISHNPNIGTTLRNTGIFGHRVRFKTSESKEKKPKADSQSTEAKRDTLPTTSISHDYRGRLKDYFSQHSAFKYDPSKPYMKQFYKMTKQFGWSDEKFRVAREGINEASVLQFNELFGEDEESLKSWQLLFSLIKGMEVPNTVKECKKRARSLQVNICDVLDARARGHKVKDYKTEVRLSEYTMDSGKFFPREHVLAGGLLSFLLRQILNPNREKVKPPKSTTKK
ncbi:hypothetical protein BDV93DRAFT_612196 [Ceratobasidium sp. AG-I]|nr:hypothetical protein BDV93DRAFT_612196 [Ceratobasidium sp. AG-I]